MRALVYTGKNEIIAWNATNEDSAFLALFRYLDDLECYTIDSMDSRQAFWYDLALMGSGEAAKKLCVSRKYDEYEGFHLLEVAEP